MPHVGENSIDAIALLQGRADADPFLMPAIAALVIGGTSILGERGAMAAPWQGR